MGGLATIERLRMMDPKVNAIICSGYSTKRPCRVHCLWIPRRALKPFLVCGCVTADVRNRECKLTILPQPRLSEANRLA
jgi:hypothetical protein